MRIDNYPKHTVKETQDFMKGKKWNFLQWSNQSHDLNPIEQLKTKLWATITHEQAAMDAA